MTDFVSFANTSLRESLTTLLEEKHLYQSVSLLEHDVEAEIRDGGKKYIRVVPNFNGSARSGWNISDSNVSNKGFYQERIIKEMIDSLFNEEWKLYDPMTAMVNTLGHKSIELDIRHISTHCGTCKNFGPMNLVRATKVLPDQETQKYSEYSIKKNHEAYTLSFQCQSCRDGIETFMVTRKGGKLTLVGRTPMELTKTPDAIPKEQRGFYSGAIIAFNSGATLPALFMLRTTLEQFVREQTKDADDHEQTKGTDIEKLFDKYKSRYSKDFNDRNPSLYAVYQRLSAVIHSANADEKVYIKCREDIDLHFGSRAQYQLTENWKANA